MKSTCWFSSQKPSTITWLTYLLISPSSIFYASLLPPDVLHFVSYSSFPSSLHISFWRQLPSLLVHLFFPPTSWNVAVCHLLYYGTVPTVFRENNIRVSILPAVFILFFRFRMSGKGSSRRRESDSNQIQLLTIKYLTSLKKSPFKDFVKAFNHHPYMFPITDNHTCWSLSAKIW